MKIQYYALLLLAGLCGCQSDDTDLEDLLADAKEEPMEISFPDTPWVEEGDEVPSPGNPSYNDYVESFTAKKTVDLVFCGDRVEVENPSGISIMVDGCHVTADIGGNSVRFNLSGESGDASLRIEGENRCLVSLQGVALTNPAGAVINNQSKKTLYLDLAEGTANSLVSMPVAIEDADAKGCIFSEGQIAFSGRGSLTVESGFRNGIASDDYVFVRPGCKIAVACSSGSGIKANDGITINGGDISISVSHNGGKGLNSEDFIDINGGRVTIINEGTTRIDKVPVSSLYPEGLDTVTAAGIKGDRDIIVSAGELRVKCTGDDSRGIRGSLGYLQTGGDVCVVTLGKKVLSSPKSVKTKGDLRVKGGRLYAYSKHSSPLDSDGVLEIFRYLRQKSYLVEIGDVTF